jgi:hypothetical protein
MSKSMLLVSLLAWIFWMDQTVYSLPAGPGDATPRQLEAPRGRWVRLAVTNTRAECETLRQARVGDATRREAALEASSGSRPRYREQYRYFCSPAAGETGQ